MKKIVKIIIVIASSLLVLFVPFISLYVHYYEGYRNVHFEMYLSDVNPYDMGKEEFLEDFEYFYQFIEDNYPYINVKERMLGYNWLDFKEEYLSRINACNNTKDFLTVMLDAVTALQNQHTHILNPSEVKTYHDGMIQYDVYPQKEVINDQVVTANYYWWSIYNDIMNEKGYQHYNLLMVYNKGEYEVVDGWEAWLDTYNLALGAKVVAIDDVPIHEAVQNSYEESYLFYDFARNRSYIQYLTPRILKQTPNFTFENTTGEIIDVTLFSNPSITYDGVNWRGYYPNLAEVATKLYPAEKVGYMQVGGMAYDPAAYWNMMMNFYTAIADYDHLIIDIRGNYGGNDYFWCENIVEPLLKQKLQNKLYLAFKDSATFSHYHRKAEKIYFQKTKSSFDYLPPEVLTKDYKIYKEHKLEYEPKNTVEFSGKITVLIDKCVYSSAEAFTVFCKNTGFATLVGTNSGGDGIGRRIYWALPHSKLVLSYSFALGLFGSGYSNEEYHTAPDIYYETDCNNFSELVDYTINYLTA
ncbi:MAG: S41 family peptidase [Candidatus Thorarchaeota archaeon]